MKAIQNAITPTEMTQNLVRAVYRAKVFFIPASVTQTQQLLNVQINDETWQVQTNDVDKLMSIYDRFKAILGNNFDGNLT